LRQDMLRRHYQMRGARVSVLGGTDPVDSFISLRAVQDNAQPAGVAQEYYKQIGRDFASYDIELDAFIDPLSAPYRARYVAGMAEVVERARNTGRAGYEVRAYPFFSDQPERGAAGAWSCGACPDCGDSVSGYFCESCGAHFNPDEIVSPSGRGGAALAFRPVPDLFFKVREPQALLRSLEAIGVAPPLRAIVARQFAKGRDTVRLSERSEWGIPIEGSTEDRFFGHGLLYSYCRLLGELYMEHTGEPVNPFDENSTVTTVNLFGIDNTVSHMVNIQAIGEETEGWKGFDAFVVNRFYLLEGKKFSTSARHLIWAHELIHTSGADSDAVRFVLAATSPTHAERDLRVDEFLHWYNVVFVGQLQAQIHSDLAKLGASSAGGIDSAVEAHFLPLWREACEGHRFSAYMPEQQVTLILAWLAVRQELDGDDCVAVSSWLRCMILLLYPVAPRLGKAAWSALGLADEPSLAHYDVAPGISAGLLPTLTAPLSLDDLFRAMPDSAVAHARNGMAAAA